MATRGRPLPASVVRQVQRLRETLSVRKTARAAAVATNTVLKYQRRGK